MAEPKYPRPKVLLIDLPDDVNELVAAAGYHVTKGTFGSSWSNDPPEGGWMPISVDTALPNHGEQEIIVADLATPALREPLQPRPVPPGETALYVKLNRTVVDLRPIGMLWTRKDFQRSYEHGANFLLFASPEQADEFQLARRTYSSIESVETLDVTNWSLLTRLDDVSRPSSRGNELYPPSSGDAMFLTPYLATAEFACTLETWDTEHWVPLAMNKYEETVAAALAPSEEGMGWIFLLPRVSRKGQLIVDLLETVLPGVSPKLFPHSEGEQWTRRDDYELPEVRTLKQDLERVEEEARVKKAKLEQRIETVRQEWQFLNDLLTATGDDLVAPVKEALERIGFERVTDVDQQQGEEGEAQRGLRREDLQVHDRSPVLLVEVKGVRGLPSESDALQVTKYVFPRAQEWQRVDVKGLSIVNHQRHLPALDRENRQVFTDDIVTTARASDFGLLTTWDLYRLVRNAVRLGWDSDVVMDVLYRTGRVHPVPSHYEQVAAVEKVYERAHAVSLELCAPLAVGDRIAYEGHVDYHEEDVESLQLVEGEDVAEISRGEFAGVLTSLSRAEIRSGARVFKITAGRNV